MQSTSDIEEDQPNCSTAVTKIASRKKTTKLGTEIETDVRKMLEENLLSPYGSIRRKSLEILSKFKWITKDENERNVFDLALEAENVPLTLNTYRDKLLLYRKFAFSEYERYTPEPFDRFRFVPFKFLIGQLNVNFTLLLPTLYELIESHARGQPQNDFWQVFGEILSSVHEKCSENRRETWMETSAENANPFWSEILNEFNSANERAADYFNFRLILWKCVERVADLAESKSRYLSDLILNLASKEIKTFDQNVGYLENITKIKENDENSVHEKNFEDKKRQSCIFKTLISSLTVFSKFNDPKNVANEANLHKLLLEFLMHGRNDIQKVSLECVLAYKSKNLMPYRENLINLLNDKMFREQLVLFSVDSESNVIEPQHRPEVMQMVLRLIYGRLFGKGVDIHRKQQIYRFLAGSTLEELKYFCEYLFLPLKKYVDPKMSVSEVCESILNEYDLTKSVPMRKLNGILSHLSMVIKRLGHVLCDYRSILFRICCVSGSILSVVEREKNSVRPYFVKFSKKLRRAIIQRCAEFFTNFDAFEFESDEIRLLYDAVVWPTFENVSLGGKNRPSSALIKFCVALSEIPRYFVLLGIYEPSRCNITLLEVLINCLVGDQDQKSLRNLAASTIFNLISLADHEANEENGAALNLPKNFRVKIFGNDEILREKELNTGTKLVLPYSTQLLTYLSRIAIMKVCRNEIWMKILVILSEFTSDKENSERLTTILLPVLKSKRVRNPEIELNLLVSVCQLMNNVEKAENFANSVAELFSIVENRNSRDVLVRILRLLATKCSNLEYICNAINELNSWSVDRIEEPDFERRLKAYVDLNAYLSSYDGKIFDSSSSTFLVHNLSYFVSTSTDLALRDQASYCLKKLVEFVAKTTNKKEFWSFLSSHVLPLLRNGLKSKEESIRHEFISVLAVCVRTAPEHSKLVGLDKLMEIGDPDTNFFENICHIQLHRRSRAIRRICEKLEDASGSIVVHADTLFHYVWPIFYSFIFEPAYSKNSNLIDESVKFLSLYCRRAPWKRYEAMLNYYLQRLQKDVKRQKLLVKILVAILDSFHFDVNDVKIEENLAPLELPMEVDEKTDGDETKRKIFDALTLRFIPELQKCLSKRTSTEFVHKTTAKFVYDEDEEILRVPLALALVKLLQKLPESYLESNLPGVLTKICAMLKSRSWDIRDATRKILCQIADSLGSRYLPYIVREMKAILRRGYQLHVLTYSTHVLLNHLTNRLVSGDLEPCLNEILSICYDDLFGEISEQKEVDEITKRLKEAKSNKTNATYQIVGRFIDCSSLDSVVESFKHVLEQKYSHLVLQKVGKALKFFSQGLICNSSSSVEMLMTFAHRILSLNVSAMLAVRKSPDELEDEETTAGRRSSCYLIDKEPPRSGALPKKSKNNSLHVLVAFGLDVLSNLLKTNRLECDNQQHCSLLDPFVTIFLDSVNAKQTKVITLALRCFCWLLKFPVPSLRIHCTVVVQRLFVLLKRFAGVGAATSKGENFELLNILFKTITTMIRDIEYCTIDGKQLKILLIYAEEDLLDVQKQSTAFALIKAIFARKLMCDEIKPVMKRIEQLSVVSQVANVRAQCRQVICNYLSNYPEGRRPRRIVEFFCAQLEYEYEEGRISALEMFNLLLDTFKEEQIDDFCLLIFVHLALRLVNDESSKVKQMASMIVRNLLGKINAGKLDDVFQMILQWLNDENLVHKKLAAHLLGSTAELTPIGTLQNILSAMVETLSNASRTKTQTTTIDDDSQIALKDHVAYLLLVAVEKYFLARPSIVRDAKYKNTMNEIWELLLKFLDHQHVWVRLAACRLVGLLFSHYKPEELLCSEISSDEYFLRNPQSTVKLLSEACLRRFRAAGCAAELCEQVTKNLVYLSRCVRRLSHSSDVGSSRATTPTDEDAVVSLFRNDANLNVTTVENLAEQLIRVCRTEVAKTPSQTLKRTNVFKWMAAVCLDCTADEFTTILPIFLPSLHREISLSDSDVNLRNLALEVVELIKNKIGMDVYSQHLAAVQKSANVKRLERKRKLAEEFVSDPEKAARRKMRRHKASRETRKVNRLIKSGKLAKKAKRFHLNIEDD